MIRTLRVSILLFGLISFLIYNELGVQYQETTLSRIKSSPSAYLNMGIKVKVIFNRITDYWAPVFTFFNSDQFINFSVWGYEQKIWFKKSLLNDYHYFYVNKNSKAGKKIIKAKKYECLYLKGVVRNVYNNRGWIEVEEAESNVTPCISEDILSLAIKANESFKEENFIETLYYSQKLEKEVLLPTLKKRTKEIKCFSYLQLNMKKQAIKCYEELHHLTREEKYKTIIEHLEKEMRKRNANPSLHLLTKIKNIVRKKNVEIEKLKREIKEKKNEKKNSITIDNDYYIDY
ncbi:MAG: hypothetical protein ACK4NF_00935 [Planctomycetota bacterium]